MMVSGPGIAEDVETEFQSINHDLYPTILGLAGVPGDADYNATVEGLSLLGVLDGTATQARNEAMYLHFPHRSNHNGGPYGAIVEGHWTFIED